MIRVGCLALVCGVVAALMRPAAEGVDPAARRGPGSAMVATPRTSGHGSGPARAHPARVERRLRTGRGAARAARAEGRRRDARLDAMTFFEANFDGLIGPTHNYAGLSPGNVASQSNVGRVSRPRQAARQGLAKARFLADLGLVQGVVPPQERPDLRWLRALGYAGSDADVLEAAHRDDPTVLAAAWSASSMWAANAATVSPAPDTPDRRAHFTPANLIGNLHRSIEPTTTTRLLRAIFPDPAHFVVHDPLPPNERFGDEGAANHVRFAPSHGEPGVELFVYGRDPADPAAAPSRYPARQSRPASEAIVRRHGLAGARTVVARQSASAIDAGVFHNDVISTGNGAVFLYHEQAFDQGERVLDDVDAALGPARLVRVCAPASEVSLRDAVSSYLFNSQLLTTPGRAMLLLAPIECRENERVRAFIERVVGDGSNPIERAEFMDVRESMRNGGGPACLRLRVVLSDEQLAAVHPGCLLTDGLDARLADWIDRTHPERLTPDDLRDAKLARSCLDALDELTAILGLGAIYPFQRGGEPPS